MNGTTGHNGRACLEAGIASARRLKAGLSPAAGATREDVQEVSNRIAHFINDEGGNVGVATGSCFCNGGMDLIGLFNRPACTPRLEDPEGPSARRLTVPKAPGAVRLPGEGTQGLRLENERSTLLS
jgi:hypothetical protein